MVARWSIDRLAKTLKDGRPVGMWLAHIYLRLRQDFGERSEWKQRNTILSHPRDILRRG